MTPRGFERIYAGRQKVKQNELYRVDALTKLRKEQYLNTMTHDFSILGSSVDLKLYKEKYKLNNIMSQRD